MDTIDVLVKAFEKYDTVKFSVLVIVVLLVLAVYETIRIKKRNMRSIAVVIPFTCLLFFISLYASTIEITNRFTIGVLDNTAATEAELKFRRTFNKCDLEIISEDGQVYKDNTDKDYTITIEDNEIAVTKYIKDLSANDEASEMKLSEVMDIADAEFAQYEYLNIEYNKIDITSDKDIPKIKIELNNEAYKKLMDYITGEKDE